MSFTTIALVAMFSAWIAAGFAAWLPWVTFNGQDRPLTRLAVAVASAVAAALLIPAIGIKGERGFWLSMAAAPIGGTVGSYIYHLWHARRMRS